MILSKKNLTVLIIGAAIAIVMIARMIQLNSFGSVDPVAARTKGPEGAKVNIVEFIDFECPACAYGAEKIKEYMALHQGDIHVQVKYYPLMNVHRHALQVASYVECVARQGKFWAFFDALMPAQSQWSSLVNAEGVFNQLAVAAGADMGKLKSCLSSEDVSTVIMNEKSVGRSLSVQSTPTYFINKKMVVGGKSLVEELDQYFQKAK